MDNQHLQELNLNNLIANDNADELNSARLPVLELVKKKKTLLESTTDKKDNREDEIMQYAELVAYDQILEARRQFLLKNSLESYDRVQGMFRHVMASLGNLITISDWNGYVSPREARTIIKYVIRLLRELYADKSYEESELKISYIEQFEIVLKGTKFPEDLAKELMDQQPLTHEENSAS